MNAPEVKTSPGFETSDMGAGTVARVLGVFAVIVAVAVAGIGFGVGWMARHDGAFSVSLTRQQTVPLQFSGPALQAHPEMDLRAVLEREDGLLLDYAWVDAAHTHARVPIGRAMAVVVGKSLDARFRISSP